MIPWEFAPRPFNLEPHAYAVGTMESTTMGTATTVSYAFHFEARMLGQQKISALAPLGFLLTRVLWWLIEQAAKHTLDPMSAVMRSTWRHL